MSNPPPIPEDNPVESFSAKALPYQAAKLSMAAPLVGVFLNVFGRMALKTEEVGIPHMILIGVSLAIYIAGGIAGIVALCSMQKYGKKGLLGRGVAGVMIAGLLCLAFIINIIDTRNKAKAGNSVQAVMKSFTDKNIESQKNYQLALAELDLSQKFQSKEELEKEIEDVKEFLNQNEEYRKAGVDAISTLTGMLDEHDVPESTKAEVLAGFKRGMAERTPIIVQIRDADVEIGEAAIGVLTTLLEAWGRWEFNEEGVPVFDEDADLKNFNRYYGILELAADKQGRLQHKLGGIQNQE